jgi:uncharacterized protein (UPF0548 family)
VSVFSLRHPGVERLSAGGPFSYPEVGHTREARLPPGYHHVVGSRVVGHGPAAFAAARQALREWAAHRAAGIEVGPPLPVLQAGQLVPLLVRIGPLWAALADRIVWVVDDDRQFGFAYGTLGSHAEVGEESFVVHRGADDAVTATIRAFSRQGHWLSRLGAPVARRVQAQATRRYLDGIAGAVRAARSAD